MLAICWVLFTPATLIASAEISTVSTSTATSMRNFVPVSEPRPPDWIPWEEESEIQSSQYLGNHPPVVLLPDLQTIPPSDLRLITNQGQGEKLIRFSNTIWNRGPGVLDLIGVFNRRNNSVLVTQNIYREDQSVIEHHAGEFEFHPTHGHWHWEGFSLYEVWTVGADGSLQHLVVTSDKVGYCVRDIAPQSPELINENSTSNRIYNSCYWARQGLSVGWNDVYRAHIPGQVVDISPLLNGVYALKSTVDPENNIVESDEANNSAVVYFSIYGDHFGVLGPQIAFTNSLPQIE